MFRGPNNKYQEFIWSERDRCHGYDNNRFAFSIGQALRYYEYLFIICDRYKTNSKEFIRIIKEFHKLIKEKGGDKLKEDELALLSQQHDLSAIIHLDIESFYVFSKIFLDKLSHFIQDYFGNVRAHSLSSHAKMIKNISGYAEIIGIKSIGSLKYKADELNKTITDYRDKEITHQNNPRTIRGTGYSRDGDTTISTTYLYPNESEQDK
jgi:hypothetical protein